MSYKKLKNIWSVEGYNYVENFEDSFEDTIDLLNKNLMIFVNPEDKVTKMRREVVLDTYTPMGITINYVEGPTFEECKDYPIDIKNIERRYKRIFKGDYYNIIDNLKYISNTITNTGSVIGVVGLLGSFIKCLRIAKEKDWDTVMIFEDDAVPINNETFLKDFTQAINKLPKNWKNEPYILKFGYTIFCNPLQILKKDNVWEDSSINNEFGSHSILYTKSAINNILNYLENNRIKHPLDIFISSDETNTILKNYTGTVSESKTFRGIFDQLYTYCLSRDSVLK